jgi:uncharacterized protein
MAGLAVMSGAAVGFSLGLIGGGGSILATPLLLYVVGISEPHIAIGTSAVAVCVSAYINLLVYMHAGVVRWRTATIFAVAGSLGALAGASFGKAFDADRLIFLFGLLMVAVGVTMLRPHTFVTTLATTPRQAPVWLQVALALTVGFAAGFFGIGGGFLIVPGIVLSTGMPMLNAIGSSLLAVGTFGLATAVNYAASGLVNWTVAALFIGGGLFGGLGGIALAGRLAHRRGALNIAFANVIIVVAAYVLWRSGQILFG